MDALDAILKANDLVAVLGREIPVRLVDISGSGCLLESTQSPRERHDRFTAGRVRGAASTRDDIWVMRCRPCEGSGALYYLGAEFLWTTSPRDRSLRRILPSLAGGAVKAVRFESLEDVEFRQSGLAKNVAIGRTAGRRA